MREIKFRGKRIDNGGWAYGYLYIHEPPLQCLQSDTSGKTTAYILKTGFADWNMTRPIDFAEVDLATVGRFTGFCDNKDKEIYEGDKCNVETSDGRMTHAFVTYIDGCFDLCFVSPIVLNGRYEDRDYLKCSIVNHAVEVIDS